MFSKLRFTFLAAFALVASVVAAPVADAPHLGDIEAASVHKRASDIAGPPYW